MICCFKNSKLFSFLANDLFIFKIKSKFSLNISLKFIAKFYTFVAYPFLDDPKYF